MLWDVNPVPLRVFYNVAKKFKHLINGIHELTSMIGCHSVTESSYLVNFHLWGSIFGGMRGTDKEPS